MIALMPGYPLRYGLQLLLDDIRKDPLVYANEHYLEKAAFDKIKSFIMSPLTKGYPHSSLLAKLIADLTVALTYRGPSISDFMHFVHTAGFNQSIYQTLMRHRREGSGESMQDIMQLMLMLESRQRQVIRMAPDVLEPEEIEAITLHYAEEVPLNIQHKEVVGDIKAKKLDGESDEVLALFKSLLTKRAFSYQAYLTASVTVANAKLGSGNLTPRFETAFRPDSAADLETLDERMDALLVRYVPGAGYGVPARSGPMDALGWIGRAYDYLFAERYFDDADGTELTALERLQNSRLEWLGEVKPAETQLQSVGEAMRASWDALAGVLTKARRGDLLLAQLPSRSFHLKADEYALLLTDRYGDSLEVAYIADVNLTESHRYAAPNHVRKAILDWDEVLSILHERLITKAEHNKTQPSLTLFRPPHGMDGGEDAGAQDAEPWNSLRLVANLNQMQFNPGDEVALTAMVLNGRPPYEFYVSIEAEGNSGGEYEEEFLICCYCFLVLAA